MYNLHMYMLYAFFYFFFIDTSLYCTMYVQNGHWTIQEWTIRQIFFIIKKTLCYIKYKYNIQNCGLPGSWITVADLHGLLLDRLLEARELPALGPGMSRIILRCKHWEIPWKSFFFSISLSKNSKFKNRLIPNWSPMNVPGIFFQ